MKRLENLGIQLAGLALAAMFCCPGLRAQEAAPAPAPNGAAKDAPADAPSDKVGKEMQNPFAAVPAPPLPAGMTGSNTNDPRYTLKPGMYDAGEAAVGLKHVLLLKKPDAFQLGTDNPDDPKVAKIMGQMGIRAEAQKSRRTCRS